MIEFEFINKIFRLDVYMVCDKYAMELIYLFNGLNWSGEFVIDFLLAASILYIVTGQLHVR